VITAVDSSVLLDVFKADPAFGPTSREAVRGCRNEGSLIACAVTWAELAAFFPSPEAAAEGMRRLGIQFSPMPLDAALAAGAAWNEYRRRGGPRTRIVSDFLIGAHALLQADRLLTRDRGFYRSYFQGLPILDPSVL
jgi:predicted nucleic acid-binding protein